MNWVRPKQPCRRLIPELYERLRNEVPPQWLEVSSVQRPVES